VKTVLIANRGEIAVRVAKTCRAMGLRSVAVYSDADRDAVHTRTADAAVAIGPAESRASYLNGAALIDAARQSGADAIHPGYGFLSQNGDFADLCRDSGIVFIGPPGDVHRRMGDKKGARRLMAAAGVPVVPGYDGDDQQDATLAGEAQRIGWPLMIKPSRGGGGKGMRVVRSRDDFAGALQSSRREALSAFGDDVMVLERFVERSRHVEVQVLADAHGKTLHLFERECSLQRRHQKVIEETPSPGLDAGTRARLVEAGVAAARAASYVNAGTVEFLLDREGRFYFLEMNTRLQVEHPVTEAVTGLDLVRLQIEVASGRPLSLGQAEVVTRGHALECRVNAEDPDNQDLPSPGRILLCVPASGPGVRFDSGIETGSEVTVHYDPLLAKLITWGRDRSESIERMAAALRDTVVLGVRTNLGRLQDILAHPAFRAGDLHTGFLDEHARDWKPSEPLPELARDAVARALRLETAPESGRLAPPDPWATLGAWRVGGGA
jgi:acetyl-CoA carboxylase biotin carboxylase subunit